MPIFSGSVTAPDLNQGDQYLREALQHWNRRIILERKPEYFLANGQAHRLIKDLPWAAETFNQLYQRDAGIAVDWNGQAMDFPNASTSIGSQGYRAKMGVSGIRWTWLELQKEILARQNPTFPTMSVVPTYRRSLKNALEAWQHRTALLGNPRNPEEFAGLINHPQIEVIFVSSANNPFTGELASSLTTAQACTAAYDLFRGEVTDYRRSALLTIGNSVVCLTSEPFIASLDRKFGDGTGDTIRSTLVGGGTGGRAAVIRSIKSVNEMDTVILESSFFGLDALRFGNGAELPLNTGKAYDLMLMYSNTADNTAQRHYNGPFYFPVQRTELEWTMMGIVASSEMIYPTPMMARMYIFEREVR